MSRPFHLLHVVGARPQFIKLFAVQQALARHPPGAIASRVLHTGQHYDHELSRVFFEDLGLPAPDDHLDIGSASHGRQTGMMLERIEQVLLARRPDVVVVYGDTNSTLAGGLAAVKLHIPVAHVEAGLRSRNTAMPEEINRVLVDHLSTWLFCPSPAAAANLAAEGLGSGRPAGSPERGHPAVVVSGDVMCDAVSHAAALAAERRAPAGATDRYGVLTIHRAETAGDPARLAEVAAFVNRMAGDLDIVFPAHPRTRAALDAHRIRLGDRVRVVAPLGYLDMIRLLTGATVVLTDSGGLQKEAYWLRVPCITLREETEWLETIESGWNVLYRDHPSDRPRSEDNGAYGDGRAADRVVSALVEQAATAPVGAGG
ncbi:MAG: UDP-N-acetylglucosamine 2-epimerase (non-hydrolyzing) [Acidimicrobiia bacterium]|nr:UDP-N-acetylglucosamine 2-epimerase (non-hydrolyzing) [Acidimicrobiia bacterium]